MPKYPHGSLSLIYHLVNTPKVQEAFHTNIEQTMTNFALSDNAKQVFRDCGAPAEPDDALIKAVMDLAFEEVKARYYEAW